ncbi:MAG: heparinase II/III family protein [Opitutaceae bacterium]|jgi:hypothetical protein|nr:heparinase II/III family protein [Opitutaceae bacterium]
MKNAGASFLYIIIFLLASGAACGDADSSSRGQLFEGAFSIRPEARGAHPRLFADERDIVRAVAFYKENPALLKKYGPNQNDLHQPPKDPSAKVDGSVFVSLARVACAWRAGGGDEYMNLLMSWRETLEKCAPVAFTGKLVKTVEDLRAGHALTGLALMYDVLKDAGPRELAHALRVALVKQAGQTYHDLITADYYPYEQNHFSIPVAGLLTAACALADEHEDAVRWGIWAKNALRRAFDALPEDGWFFEGATYWSFTAQFTIGAAFALDRTTGENWFDRPPLRDTGLYLAHIHTPGSRHVFDFADCGPRGDANSKTGQKGYDAPWHSLATDTNFAAPLLLARRQGGAFLRDWLREAAPAGGLWRSDAVLRLLLAPELPEKSVPSPARAEPPPWHYFPDTGVVHWRARWGDPQATALAFKSGPPAGHRYAVNQPTRPEWRSSLGHAHPDAGSFILFSKGVFLANDTGYVGIKETADHNSILVDGIGQHKGGTTWGTFRAKPQSEYNMIRMENVRMGPDFAAATAIFEAAYDDALQIKEMRRDLLLVQGRFLVIRDRMQSEKKHSYQWRLHTDKQPASLGNGRFVMENGPARLVLQNLDTGLAAKTAPTIVEVSLTPKTASQKFQRGFHLELSSPVDEKMEFLNAFCIQSTDETPGAFQAVRIDEKTLELRDGSTICRVTIGDDGQLGHSLQ